MKLSSMKRFFNSAKPPWRLAGVLAIALVLTACGDADPTASDSASAPDTASDSAAETPAEPSDSATADAPPANMASYPQPAIDEFLEGCETGAQGMDYAQQVCQCTIDTVQADYTFEEFERINAALGAGEQLPDEILSITANCYSEISLEETGSAYPPQVISNFMESCTGGDETMQGACECAIAQIQEQYTFEDFMRLDRDVQEGGTAPEGITAIMQACVNDPTG